MGITYFTEAVTNMMDPVLFILIIIGVAVGIIFGSIPGLTATMAIVMFLPMTYSLSPLRGISMLVALYIGGISGGLISAIMLNIPGTPSSIATCFDGNPMAKKGEGAKALGTGIFFSFIGTLIGVFFLVLLTPILASIAIKFGPYEYCALAIFSFSFVIILTGKDMVRGLISVALGAMFATVGLSPIDSMQRFTFGNFNLTAGFKLLVFLIGLFAITEVLKFAEQIHSDTKYEIRESIKVHGIGFTFQEFVSQIPNALRSAMIGLGIGILPGIGGSVSSMLSYTIAKNTSKYPEKFGTGIMDGVVASETANNATIGGAMIPLLSLGIPGDGTTAVLLGGLMIHGIAPGPLIFQKNGPVIYGIFISMVFASAAMLLLEFGLLNFFVKILKIPKQYLYPVIIILCCVGAIGDANRIFDCWGILLFGIIGFIFLKGGFSLIPMILGFILGPMLELNLRRASMLVQKDMLSIVQHPIALVFLLITTVAFVINIRSQRKLINSSEENHKEQ